MKKKIGLLVVLLIVSMYELLAQNEAREAGRAMGKYILYPVIGIIIFLVVRKRLRKK